MNIVSRNNAINLKPKHIVMPEWLMSRIEGMAKKKVINDSRVSFSTITTILVLEAMCELKFYDYNDIDNFYFACRKRFEEIDFGLK